MATVETALGSLATDQLGPTLMHEHIVTRSPGVHENWPHLFDRNAILALAEQKLADLPHWHYTHISDDILPALRAAGVTTDQIEQMLVRNPRAIFEGVG
jgi:predicted metal-dependent phosphotriesterase family hydrolase